MNAKPKRILVIDDEEAIRKSFALALEDTGHRIDVVASGEEGIECHQTDPYDLIFLDLKMPGMSGAETLLNLRRKDLKVPIYIVTAFYEEFFEDLQEVRRKGLDFELMRKPVGADQIVQVTNSILEERVAYLQQ